MSSVNPSVGANTQPRRSTVSSSEAPSQDTTSSSTSEGLPPQRHAGAVGLGPAYHQGPGFGDKLVGLEEEIKGKIMKKPELVEQGRERRTGALKKKELEQDDKDDPFAKPGDQSAPTMHKGKGELEHAASVSPQKEAPGETGTL
ncbi:hypothetical protein K503DRAFT_765889 [Rhizopogon vinicolor AM-OR11-026]|uniref:Uncharacterized protein n=1 Tax=Rhizopogon vinicolor AM-OR11-026 TaxID=1314800 RepID=A0A1B7NF76_9AGAM|nr:hypothetical protein K503DRAFT_765889 [Rhizopogon vinicolor AM-OR11-026]